MVTIALEPISNFLLLPARTPEQPVITTAVSLQRRW